MATTAIERELHERLSTLRPDQQRQVLEYVRTLGEAPGRGVPGRSLLRFSGAIPGDDLAAMARAIEEDCERVDLRDW